jgi:tyrosine phenol-lyase
LAPILWKREVDVIIRLSDGRELPIEMYKVRIVQKTTLPPIGQRLAAVEEAGYNTFLLWTKDISSSTC